MTANAFIKAGASLIMTAALAQVCFAQDFSVAQSINNKGEIVGGSLLNDQSAFHAFIRSKHGTLALGTFGGVGSRADNINDRGDAVGQADTGVPDTNGDPISLAFLAAKDGVHNLGTLPGFTHSQAFAVNNAGTVVGFSYNLHPIISGVTLPGFQAFVYAQGEMLVVGHLGGGSSVAFGINNSGTVVGRSRLANGQTHAFLYAGGVIYDLGTLGGTSSEARAINSRGDAVGQAALANGQRHAALFLRDGSVIDLGTLGGGTSRAWGINDNGLIVGESLTAEGELHAFVYEEGVMRDLGTLGGGFSIAFGVNNRGQIVGVSETAEGDIHAFVFEDGVMTDIDADLPQ